MNFYFLTEPEKNFFSQTYGTYLIPVVYMQSSLKSSFLKAAVDI